MMNTEKRGLLRKLYGTFRAIAEQAKDPSYTMEDAKHDLKWLATADGYPTKKRKVQYKGSTVEWVDPVSLSGQSTEIGMILLNTAHVLADERNLYLYEYRERYPNDPDPEPFRSMGGRSYEEMQLYIENLEKCGDVEGARKLKQKPRWYKPEKKEHPAQELDIF